MWMDLGPGAAKHMRIALVRWTARRSPLVDGELRRLLKVAG